MSVSISREDFNTTLTKEKQTAKSYASQGNITNVSLQIFIETGGTIRIRDEGKYILLEATHPSNNVTSLFYYSRNEQGKVIEECDTNIHLAAKNIELKKI